jgi:tetratricopeptide (TPR) repeat protein
MPKTIVPTILLALISFTQVVAQQIDPPKLTPTPATDSQKQLIKEGVTLHDRGDYEGAIAKYEEVLRENPTNDLALYELAFAYQIKKEYRKSLEVAYKGAQYKSDNLTGFYLLIGNNLDFLGESKKAVEVFRKAIKLAPDDQLLYYNLGITYARLNNIEDAKKNLKKAAFMNPNHASSHFVLAQLFNNARHKTPALFAVMRFLVIEPRSQRSANAYKVFAELMLGGVSPGKTPNDINIFVDLGGNKDEGDFGSLEMLVGLTSAVGVTEKNKDKSEVQRLVDQLDTFLALVSESDAKGDKSKFTWRYYIPYFIELKKRNYVEPFAYYISQTSNMSNVPEWLQANESRVKEFVSWSRNYQWPKE